MKTTKYSQLCLCTSPSLLTKQQSWNILVSLWFHLQQTSLLQGCRVVWTGTAQTLSFPEKDGPGVFNLNLYCSCRAGFSCGVVN